MGLEKEVLQRLDEEYDVQDVFFSDSILYVLNAYDVPYVESFLEATTYPIRYKLCDEELAFLAQ